MLYLDRAEAYKKAKSDPAFDEYRAALEYRGWMDVMRSAMKGIRAEQSEDTGQEDQPQFPFLGSIVPLDVTGEEIREQADLTRDQFLKRIEILERNLSHATESLRQHKDLFSSIDGIWAGEPESRFEDVVTKFVAMSTVALRMVGRAS
jgi:hypothetical protein